MSDLHDLLADSSHDHASAAALICRQRKLDVEAQDSKGRTLLHLAAASGNLCAAENLLAKGANPNARNKYGSTPLHMAITNGHTELAIGKTCAISLPALIGISASNNERKKRSAVSEALDRISEQSPSRGHQRQLALPLQQRSCTRVSISA